MCKQFGITVVKGVTALGNAVLLISACCIVARTSVVYHQYKSYSLILEAGMKNQPLAALIFGSLLLAISLFGFLGILLNAFGMICFFVTVLFALGISSAILGTYILSETGDMLSDPQYFVNKVDQTPNITQDSNKMESINAVQKDLQCCGFGLGKYQYYNESEPLPLSCCKDPTSQCFGEDIWDDNCLEKIELFGVVTHSEMGTVLICAGAQSIIVGAIGYVLAMAVRQYYYY